MKRLLSLCLFLVCFSTLLGQVTSNAATTSTPSITSAEPNIATASLTENSTASLNLSATPDIQAVATPSINASPTPAITATPTPSIEATATPNLTSPNFNLSIPSTVNLTPATPAVTVSSNVVAKPAISLPTISTAPPTIAPEDLYVYFDEQMFRYPLKPRQQYPDIAIDGSYDMTYSGRDFSPKIGNGPGEMLASDPRWDRIRNDPFYNKLPRDVLIGDPQFLVETRLGIDGQLDEDLSVHFDVEQIPDLPGRYDIWVDWKENRLSFYHLDAEFVDGDYINVKKALNGAKFEHKGADWEATVATGRQRSNPQKRGDFGTGASRISMGHRNILFGSVKVWLNNQIQQEGVDYQINYYDGEIIFLGAPPSQSDFIQYIFEFTNPIEDFIPVLNRKNFHGVQYKWRSQPIAKKRKVKRSFQESIRTSKDAGTIEGPAVFYLAHSPIVLGSDIVKLNGTALLRNEEYFIKHHTGRLKIFDQNITPEDEIEVSYDYFLADTFVEDLIGQDTRGPYDLGRQDILDGSVEIYLNDTLLTEALDYILDYDVGQLYFNYVVNYPSIITVKYTAIRTETESIEGKKSPLRFGFTWLNENVRGQQDEVELKAPSENVVITGNNTIFTSQTPLINTSNIRIQVNGTTVSANNYTIVSAYKGEIQIEPSVIGAATSAVISYDYRKSYRTSFPFKVAASEETVYINRITPGFDLQDIPVKFNGIAYILLEGPERSLRLSDSPNDQSYVVDYVNQDDGIGIKITFLEQDPSNTSSLAPLPQAGETLTLVYDFTPNTTPDAGNINQNMIGLTLGADLNEKWTFDAEVAAANHNFSKPQIDHTFTGQGVGQSGASYFLENRNLVENSEAVFIRQGVISSSNALVNNRLTKDDDYVINYTTGELRFINLIPGPTDQIVVDYKFFDTGTSGITESGIQQNFKLATKLSTTYTEENLTIEGHYKNVDRQFLPFSPIQDPNGSQQFGGSLDWSFHEKDNINLAYFRRDTAVDLRDDTDQYKHEDTLTAKADLELFEIFDTTHDLRYTFTLQDPLNPAATFNRHPIDDLAINYNFGVSFGPESFKNNFTRGYGRTVRDYIDRDLLGEELTESIAYNSAIKFTDVFLLREVDLNPDYSRAFTRSTSRIRDIATSGNPITLQEGRVDSRAYGLGTSIRPMKNLTTAAAYKTQSTKTLTAQQTEEQEVKTINENYDVDYTPVKWLDLGFNKRRVENESKLLNQAPNVDITNVSNIKRFEPYGMMTHLGARSKNPFVKAFKNSFLTARLTQTQSLKNNNLNDTQAETLNIGFNRFRPIRGFTLSRFKYSQQSTEQNNLAPTNTTSQNIVTSVLNSTSAQMNYKPRRSFLRYFNYEFGYEQVENTRTNDQQATNVTSNKTITEQPRYTRNQGLNFSPGRVKKKILWVPIDLGNVNMSVNENWTDSIDKDIITRTAPGEQPIETSRQDNAELRKYTYKYSMRLFNKIGFNTTYITDNERRSRNKVVTNVGLLFKDKRNLTIASDFKPFRFLELSSNFQNTRSEQYQSSDLETSLDALKSARETQTGDFFTDFIGQRQNVFFAQATFTPVKWYSLRGSGQLKVLQDERVTTASRTLNDFSQRTPAIGSVIRPVKGLELSYDYAASFTTQGSGNSNRSNTVTQRLKYTPFQTKNYKVFVDINRTHNWGQDLNTFQQEQTEAGRNTLIQTQITEVDNEVMTGSLNIEINIPLDNTPFVDRLVIHGEGYVKTVTDHLDNPNDDIQDNSFDLSGMMIKGSLHF